MPPFSAKFAGALFSNVIVPPLCWLTPCPLNAASDVFVKEPPVKLTDASNPVEKAPLNTPPPLKLTAAPLAALKEPPNVPLWPKSNAPFKTLTVPALVKSTPICVAPLPCDFVRTPLLSSHSDPYWLCSV